MRRWRHWPVIWSHRLSSTLHWSLSHDCTSTFNIKANFKLVPETNFKHNQSSACKQLHFLCCQQNDNCSSCQKMNTNTNILYIHMHTHYPNRNTTKTSKENKKIILKTHKHQTLWVRMILHMLTLLSLNKFKIWVLQCILKFWDIL